MPGAQLEAQLDLQARARVQGDESMLRRVIENLLVNALEAMNGNGALRVQTWDECANGSRSTSVGLAIADGGCGIPEDFLRHRLFRPFATTKKTGLGLGLYQSHAIVRAHGGSFDIESSPGNGTSVRILFPATPPSSPGEQTLQPEREPEME